MHSGERWRLGHRPGLDGLRGVAVLLVLVAHGEVPHLRAAGGVGVTVFFTLSGFLIASLLLEETDRTGRLDVIAFYRRRALRLLPALVAVVLVVTAIGLVVDGYTSAAMIGGSLLYVGNWVMLGGSHVEDALSHTWSLSIEEQFYAVAPFVVLALHRRPRTLFAACVVGSVTALAARSLICSGPLWDGGPAYYNTGTRVDALLVGVALAVLVRSGRRRVARPALWAAGVVIGLCVLTPIMSAAYYVLVPTLVAVATAVVIAGSLDHAPMLERPWLLWVGRRSYGAYLWHYPVLVLARRLDLPWPVLLAASLTAGLGLAALSWRYVEAPFLRLKVSDSRPRRAVMAPVGSDG